MKRSSEIFASTAASYSLSVKEVLDFGGKLP
jgi:hypothetical protein